MSRVPPWAKRQMARGPRPDLAAQLTDFAVEVIDRVIASSDGQRVISAAALRDDLSRFDDPDPYLEQIYERLADHYADEGFSLIEEHEIVVALQINH